MMNRRSFLQVLGLGVVGSTVIGKIIPITPQKPSIPEFGLILEPQPAIAKPRQLKATYTIELAQDLKAFHSIDTEREWTMLIQKEIDREVLKAIQVAA